MSGSSGTIITRFKLLNVQYAMKSCEISLANRTEHYKTITIKKNSGFKRRLHSDNTKRFRSSNQTQNLNEHTSLITN